MVECFNHSLLQLLRAYVERQSEWEQYLPFILFAYRTTVHTSTGVSPFVLMFGRPSVKHPPQLMMQYLIKASYVQSCHSYLILLKHISYKQHKTKKSTYDHNTLQRPFTVGDQVWLASPTAGKSDPKWEGQWKIQSIQGPTTYTITDGDRIKTVHINHIHPRIQPTAISNI